MLRTAWLRLLLLVPTAGVAADADCTQAPNQMEANACAAQTFAQADAELDRRYAALRDKLDGNGRHNLVAAQRAWIAFRDLECNLRTGYDATAPEANGTIAPLLQAACRTQLTRQRSGDLAAQVRCPGGDLACAP
jgi:uncharacterized protein YecT (DUF1311 family)